MAAISFQEGLRKLSFTIRHWLNDNAIVNKGILINNFDLNDFTNTGSSGYYFLSETNSYINIPNDFSKEGILINFVNNDNFYQIIIDLDNYFYIRKKNNNIWFSWKYYNVDALEEQILNINEFIGNVEEPKETSIIKKIEKIEENSKELEKKVENLEYASKGVLYTDITNEGIAKSVTITDDVFPYGALSMIGGASYTRARNFVPYPYQVSSSISNGISRRIKNDASIYYVGDSTKDVPSWLFTKSGGWNPGKHKFFLSGCPKGGSDDTYYLQVALFATASSTVPLLQVRDYGDGALVDASNLDYECMTLLFIIKAGTSIDDIVKPQLELDKKTEWEPNRIKRTPVKRIVGTRDTPLPARLSLYSAHRVLVYYDAKKCFRLEPSSKFAGVDFRLFELENGKTYTLFLRHIEKGLTLRLGDSLVEITDSTSSTRAQRWLFSNICDIDNTGISRLTFTYNGTDTEVPHLKFDLEFSRVPPTGSSITFLIDIREGSVDISDDLFKTSINTFVYEVPDELISAYDYGQGFINYENTTLYNYIDFEEKAYHQDVKLLTMESAADYQGVVQMSDGEWLLVPSYYSGGENVLNVSKYINDEDIIVPVAKGDVISFETYDGEVPVPVPYAIKYQVKV